jgi:hypothetical protein
LGWIESFHYTGGLYIEEKKRKEKKATFYLPATGRGRATELL